MRVDRLTLSGVDDSVAPEALAALSSHYAFVEWGVLLDGEWSARPRYPSIAWVRALLKLLAANRALKVAAHFCGTLADASLLSASALEGWAWLLKKCSRLQINHSPSLDGANPMAWRKIAEVGIPVVLPVGARPSRNYIAATEAHVAVQPLFDLSHGRGISPPAWPAPFAEPFGYAGGLAPRRLREQIGAIERVAGGRTVWLDIESGVRSDHGGVTFDLGKAKVCLDEVASWSEPGGDGPVSVGAVHGT